MEGALLLLYSATTEGKGTTPAHAGGGRGSGSELMCCCL